jgi:lactoylglutathione lyase
MRMYFASVIVSDEDRAIDFYTNKLGFKLLADNPTPFGGRFLMFAPPGGGTKLVASGPIPGREERKAGGFTNIAWEVDDIQATCEAWAAKGVQFPQPPTKQPWGGVQAVFADQDGNQFQLMQSQGY